MNLLPRSLFGRNVLLILALIAFGQLTGGLLFQRFVQKPRVEQLAAVAVRQIKSTEALLESVNAGERAMLIARMNAVQVAGGPSIRIDARAPPENAAGSPREELTAQFARLVAAHLHYSDLDIRWTADHGGSLSAPLHLGASTYWISVQGLRLEGNLWLTWLGLSLLTALLAIGGALLIQRRINRPLRTLVDAAQRIARGGVPDRLDETAPTEIATVSRAFNQMTQSLARIDQERVIMLAGVSHDLRTPLAKLRLGVEILRDRSEPEIVQNMLRSTAEMDAIIDQFLEYARGSSTEPAAPADLNEIVRRCAQRYAAHGHTLTTDCGELPSLPLRIQAMERLLTNLVENALHYGQPEFRIVTRCKEGCVQLSVIDHGPGLAATELQAIKRPFVRGSSARSGKPGAGLGLAIVERIAQSHGGHLQLLAAAGGGLEARVELPISGDRGMC